MAKKKTKAQPAETVSFEESLEQLKDVVAQLEDGNLTLSESLEKYELGVKNLKCCYQALEQVQKKIELLVDIDEDGNLITRPFDDAATNQPTRRMTRQADIVEDVDFDEELEDGDDYDEDVDDPHSLF